MIKKYEKEKRIFLLLGHVPGGLTMKDLKLKTEEKKEQNPSYESETFYGRWENFLNELMDEQQIFQSSELTYGNDDDDDSIKTDSDKDND